MAAKESNKPQPASHPVGPSYTRLESQLTDAVKSSLRSSLFSNAAFLAERLFAAVSTEETRLLLAESYLGENKLHKAYWVLKEATAPANRYRLALVCLRMRKCEEAERALTMRQTAEGETQVAGDAAGYYVLGLLSERQARY